jgi:hypothetical protein
VSLLPFLHDCGSFIKFRRKDILAKNYGYGFNLMSWSFSSSDNHSQFILYGQINLAYLVQGSEATFAEVLQRFYLLEDDEAGYGPQAFSRLFRLCQDDDQILLVLQHAMGHACADNEGFVERGVLNQLVGLLWKRLRYPNPTRHTLADHAISLLA